MTLPSLGEIIAGTMHAQLTALRALHIMATTLDRLIMQLPSEEAEKLKVEVAQARSYIEESLAILEKASGRG